MDVVEIITRVVWVMDRAPYSMGTKFDLINGSQTGFLQYTASDGSRVRERWIAQTLLRVLADFTTNVMLTTYGFDMLYTEPENRNEPFLIRYQWKAHGVPFYMGFSKRDTALAWLKQHEPWMEACEQIRWGKSKT